MEFKNMTLLNINKPTHRYENKLVVTSGEREGRKGKTGVED